MKSKSNYVARAEKFLPILMALFAHCSTCEDYEYAVKHYNATHSRPLRYSHGVSRFVIIRADYVIKFNIDDDYWSHAGDNSSELVVYNRAKKAGYSYLLAKPTIRIIDNHVVTIMPRVNGVNNEHKNFWDYCTAEEWEWLDNNIFDLHEGNVGYYHNKPVIIDYAWDAQQ